MAVTYHIPDNRLFDPTASREDIEEELTLVTAIMSSIPITEPGSDAEIAHHRASINRLQSLLRQRQVTEESDSNLPESCQATQSYGDQSLMLTRPPHIGFDNELSNSPANINSNHTSAASTPGSTSQSSLKRRAAPQSLDLSNRKRVSNPPSTATTAPVTSTLFSWGSPVDFGGVAGQGASQSRMDLTQHGYQEAYGAVQNGSLQPNYVGWDYGGGGSGPHQSVSRDSATSARRGRTVPQLGSTTPMAPTFNPPHNTYGTMPNSLESRQSNDGHSYTGDVSAFPSAYNFMDLTGDFPVMTPTEIDFSYATNSSNQGTMPNNFTSGNDDPFAGLDLSYSGQQVNQGLDYGQYPAAANSLQDLSNMMTGNELAQFMATSDLQTFPGIDSSTNTAMSHGVDNSGNYAHHQLPYRGQHHTLTPSEDLAEFSPSAKTGGLNHTSGDAPEDISNLLQNITDGDDVPPEQREPTPYQMKSQLMEHQKIGLSWLKNKEQGPLKGGILADDMGLGKTIQALALILARPSDDAARKTTLIVAPVALMRQWQAEIRDHVRAEHRLKVFVYHGNGTNTSFDKLRNYDVVLTTFQTLAQEYKKWETLNSQPGRAMEVKQFGLIGKGSNWYRVIIDEAQGIKNRQTLTARGTYQLRAKHRLCMTGTPMMNSIEDLYSLIKFLRINPYAEWSKFNFDILKHVKNGAIKDGKNTGIERVQVLLKSIMLRRTKDSTIDGAPIIVLPSKHIHRQDVILSKDERDLYDALQNKTQLKVNKYLSKGTVSNNYANMLVLLLRLRQACCHPHLIKDLAVQASTDGISEEQLLERAKELGANPIVLNRLKNIEGFECPICYDGTDNPTIFLPCGHGTCGECSPRVLEPARNQGAEGPRCPECRAVVSADQITDFFHFLMVFLPEKLRELEKEGAITGVDVESEDESDSDSDDEDSQQNGDLKGFVVPDDVEDDDEQSSQATSSTGRKPKQKDDNSRTKKPKKTLADLKKESLRNKAAKRKYLKRLRRNWKSSAKIESTLELLDKIYKDDPTEKALIFSQFTSLLDLLEIPLVERGISYQRYDGSMDSNSRADAVEAFKKDPNTRVMIISLKAGNSGLNLTAASQVIILDPFWNPYVEDQAVDRSHRMMQKREVHVHRILAPDTVEDRICELQERKREMITAALDENSAKGLVRLGIQDLMYLFGMHNTNRN